MSAALDTAPDRAWRPLLLTERTPGAGAKRRPRSVGTPHAGRATPMMTPRCRGQSGCAVTGPGGTTTSGSPAEVIARRVRGSVVVGEEISGPRLPWLWQPGLGDPHRGR